MKKILVPIKRVPDYELKLKINSEGSGIESQGIKWIVNPFDEIAVEEAIRVRESGQDVEITVVTIGPEDAKEQLRSALAMGADKGILVKAGGEVDSYLAHLALKDVYSSGDYSLVIMGKQSIDSDANQTGQLLAASLDLPQATFASKLEVEGDFSKAKVTREVDGGLETLEVSLPAVVTTDLRLNEPRYPSLPNIVKAKKKPIEEKEIKDIVGQESPRVKVHVLASPPKREAGVMVGSTSELVEKLKEKGVL